MDLKDSRTAQNLREAFDREAQANRRYLFFAGQAEAEGRGDLAALFRAAAEGETGHAMGHLEFLQAVGDPVTGLPIGNSRDNLLAAEAGERHESHDMYPSMARIARAEGFDDVAEWFETLAAAERSHAGRFRKAIEAWRD